ncbi:hypothetical protein I0C86_15540 [Plantactinospora sp. S1510]|uniref:Uncharacterized protein n=1 Tax=Plantactinospora alkalitolerans TaxID=2789879 RepID=A0ABS0GWQ6_9ACTN|nr:hypothetical protein [Plantactinospora alkalitolerans]MBF9130359.1 hypothetical protein [Plantactinospora alkalitolerans]
MTEDLVESTLRDTLQREADGVGVLEDPWPGFARREVRHRRTRRLGTLGVAAGVVAIAVGIQAGVVPLPGRPSTVATASAPSALAEGPTRGSLAGDRAWLTAFRDQVDGFDDPRGRGRWEVADRKEIRIVYASDRPGLRLALAYAPLRLGSDAQWHFLWYEGATGAAARQMRASGGEQDTDPSVLAFLRATPEDGGFGIAIGPLDSTVTIIGEPHYSPSGRVEPRQLAVADGAGVAVAVLPPSPSISVLLARVTRNGDLVHQERLAGGAYGPSFGLPGRSTDAVLDAAVRGARGPELDRAVLTDFISAALEDSCLPSTGVAVRLLWSGPVQGQTAALLTVQPTGGGVLAYVMRRGTDGSGWTDLRLLLPAEGAERRPIGWRLRGEDSETRTDEVMVVAPAGAATASVTIGGAAPVPVPLDPSKAGTTRVPLGRSATVTAYSADGSVLASTPVPPGEDDSSGLPGDTPGTRVVP